MPEGAIYVGRPTRYGNPVGVDVIGSREKAKEAYRHYLWQFPEISAYVKRTLCGKDLACWCPLDQPCHADVLLEVANAGEVEAER